MKKLAEIISIQDADRLLENIHAMVALVEVNGALVAWNAAFEARKKPPSSGGSLADLFLPKDESVLEKLKEGTHQRWSVIFPPGGADAAETYDCLLIPTQDGRRLFVAERAAGSSRVLAATVERLNRRVKMFQVESDHTKKLARNKQIELEAVMTQAQEISQVDPLTFLLNRRAILRELQGEVLRAERYKTPLSISIVDVDNFKSVNDTYGHAVGDEVLRRVAHRLREGVRHPDMVGRYGGEEFLILLPSSTLSAAMEQAARLCRHVRETGLDVKDNIINVTLSMGVAQLKIGEETWDDLLNRADSAMYTAKSRGRNGWAAAE
jgi:diguanylate cyclase (GGDEF)-like protein